MKSIATAPGSVRLTVGAFCIVILCFALLAQAQLWEHDGAGELPTLQDILWKYNGRPNSSRLHVVLDPDLPEDNELAMYPYLGEPHEIDANRERVYAWVAAGAPESAWDDIGPIFTNPAGCGQCHAAEALKEDMPFATYADVLPFAKQDTGMSKGALLTSAHNHLFAFAVLALLLSLMLCHSRWTGLLRVGLIVGAFLGPLLDVGGWLLTSAYGSPFHYVVWLGGALFGAATGGMAVLILADTLRIGVPREIADA